MSLRSNFLSLLLCCLYCRLPSACASGTGGTTPNAAAHHHHHPSPKPFWITRKYRSQTRRLVEKVFSLTDTNDDDRISFDEAYVGFLQLYVRLNRRAPVSPPSRDDALLLFLEADVDGSNYLSVEQYYGLLQTAVGRAFVRLTAHKVATWVGAPSAAELIVRDLAGRREWLEGSVRRTVPGRWREKVVPVVSSPAFQRTLFTTVLVSTLGNICLAVANFILRMSLPKIKPSDERWKGYKKR